ncbi:unnamed protein product, partial [Symbiodinium necroappetens]
MSLCCRRRSALTLGSAGQWGSCQERLRVTEASLKAAEERRQAAEAQLKAAKATEEALQERVSGLQRSLQAARGKRQNRVNGIVAKSRAVLDWVAEEDAKDEDDKSTASATSATGPDTSAPSKQTATVTSVPGPTSSDVSSLFGESTQGVGGASSVFEQKTANTPGATADPSAAFTASAAGPDTAALFEQAAGNAPGPTSSDVSSLFGESTQ